MLNNSSEHKNDRLLDKYMETHDLNYLGELYKTYMHLVYGVCLKYFKNREEAQDGVMQIFEKLIIEVHKQEIRNFKNWLYVLTKNYCLMHLRSSRTKTEKEKKFLLDQEIFMESEPEMHPIDEENSEMNNALKECIDKLKREQRQCIELFYYQDKSYQEISDILKMEEKKVKSYLQNGKRNLKICLEGKDVEKE